MELTQTGLGARVGLNQSQICKFEQNGATSFEIFLKASRGLDLPAWVLLKVAEDPNAFEEICLLKPNTCGPQLVRTTRFGPFLP